MSKPFPRSRNSKNPNTGRAELLYKKWSAAVWPADNYFSTGAGEFCRSFKRFCVDKLHHFIQSDNRSSGSEEKIYQLYIRLMDAYGTIMREFSSSSGFDNRNLAIDAEAVISILRSRLKKYDGRGGAQNPVLNEKKEILRANIHEFVTELDTLASLVLNEKIPGFPIAGKLLLSGGMGEARYLADAFREDFLLACIPETYALYEQRIKKSLDEINNFEKRRHCSRYYSQLSGEYRVLKTVILYQIPLIENDISRAILLDEEKELAFSIINGLKEAFRFLEEEGLSLLEEYKEAFEKYQRHGIIVDIGEQKDFEEGLRACLDNSGYFPEDNLKSIADESQRLFTEFLAILENEVILPEFNNKMIFAVNKEIYEMKKLIADTRVLTEEIIPVFVKVIAFAESNREQLRESKNREIIDGINETLKIKVESLSESKEQFAIETGEALEQAVKILDENSVQDFERLKKACLQVISDDISGFSGGDRRVLSFFKRFSCDFSSFETLSQLLDRLQKQSLSYFEPLKKKVLLYKKENILFELSTFEEIITYSVSRIMDSQSDADVKYLNCIMRAEEEISIILKYSGISLIRPEPHEVFNAKEHEVLLAEKNEEFKKGEIIKLMNSGYKQNDTVIIRANVVACK